MQTLKLSIIDDTPRSSPNEIKKHFNITINLEESTGNRDIDIVLKVSELQQAATSNAAAIAETNDCTNYGLNRN